MKFDDFNKVFGSIFYANGFNSEMIDVIFRRYLNNVTSIVESDSRRIYILEDKQNDDFKFMIDKNEVLYGGTQNDLLSNENAKFFLLSHGFVAIYIKNNKIIMEEILSLPLENNRMFIKAECYNIDEVNELLNGEDISIGSEHFVYLLKKLVPQLKITVIVDPIQFEMYSKIYEKGIIKDKFGNQPSPITPYAAAYNHFTNLLENYIVNNETKKREQKTLQKK